MIINKRVFNSLKQESSDFWFKEGSKQSLQLFHRASSQVPAYKDFLKKVGIKPKLIRNLEDFQKVPPITKDNYLKKYPIEKLCWNGKLNRQMVYTATSGSTGEPVYFLRTEKLDAQCSFILKAFLDNNKIDTSEPTLVINAFSMGIWIGGLITYKAFEIAAKEWNYPLSIITPGINTPQILSALRKLSPKYKQTILVGYPPFVKDILDTAKREKINISKLRLHLVFAAESFNENFRKYVSIISSIKRDITQTMNIYGSAELGAMANETPLTILFRKAALKNTNLYNDLFNEAHRTPTLAQYCPYFINFEENNGELYITGDNAIPFIRYAIGDQGGVISFTEAIEKCKQNNIDISRQIFAEKIRPTISQMPLVYVYERKDFVISFYGLQLYPEHIRVVLLDAVNLKYLTGKFTMETKYDKKQNQFLEIKIELKPNIKVNTLDSKAILEQILENLKKKNSEFNELHKYLGNRAVPKLIFLKYQDPKYFVQGVKQKWVIKA